MKKKKKTSSSSREKERCPQLEEFITEHGVIEALHGCSYVTSIVTKLACSSLTPRIRCFPQCVLLIRIGCALAHTNDNP